MDPFDYFFMEEFIFPEQGGVTGTRQVPCPHCGIRYELPVDPDNTDDQYQCGNCGGRFSVDWPDELVTAIDEEDDELEDDDDECLDDEDYDDEDYDDEEASR